MGYCERHRLSKIMAECFGRSVCTTGYDIGLFSPKPEMEREGEVYVLAYSRRTGRKVFSEWLNAEAVRDATPERLARAIRKYRRTGEVREELRPEKPKNVKP